MRGKSFLQRRKGVGRAEALDRFDLRAVRLYGEHQAGAHRAPVDYDRASAADAMLAAEMCSGEAARSAQEIGEMNARLHVCRVRFAVDAKRDAARIAHANCSARCTAAARSARSTVTAASRRR